MFSGCEVKQISMVFYKKGQAVFSFQAQHAAICKGLHDHAAEIMVIDDIELWRSNRLY